MVLAVATDLSCLAALTRHSARALQSCLLCRMYCFTCIGMPCMSVYCRRLVEQLVIQAQPQCAFHSERVAWFYSMYATVPVLHSGHVIQLADHSMLFVTPPNTSCSCSLLATKLSLDTESAPFVLCQHWLLCMLLIVCTTTSTLL